MDIDDTARESALAERERHDKEKVDSIKARQIRLGHVPNPDAEVEDGDEMSKAKPKATPRKKST